MPFRPFVLCGASALLCLALTPPSPSAAQDASIEWTQVTRVEAPGMLGTILARIPGLARETPQGFHLYGNRLRSDQGSFTSIFDAENQRWISMDHEDRYYTEFSLDDMRESMEVIGEVRSELQGEVDAMHQEMRSELGAEWDQLRDEMRVAMEEAEANWDVQIRTDATNEMRAFGPATARRHFITVEIKSTEGFGSLDGVEEEMEDGSLVLLVDLWQSTDFPNEDHLTEEFARQISTDPELMRFAEENASALAPVLESFSGEALALWDPRIAAAFRRAGDAIQTVEGKTMASTTHFALVRDGEALDRDDILAWEPESMGDQLRGAAVESAGEAARDAARGAVRGLTRGMFGRGGGDDEEEDEGPAVRPLFRFVSEMTDIQMGTPSPERFTIPEGYTRANTPGIGEGR